MNGNSNILSLIALFGLLCGLLIFAMFGVGVIHLRQSLMAERARCTRNTVETAVGIADYFYALQRDGTLTELEARIKARDSIRAMRHSDSGYMLVFRMDGIAEVHGAMPQNEGRQRINLQTERGKFVVQDFIRAARAGNGYVFYDYPKPGTSAGSVSKMAYVYHYAPWDWIVASGLYVDDINKSFKAYFIEWVYYIVGPFVALLVLTATLARMIRKPFDELQRAKEQAESASRAKTSFISNVSHEIRTPLTSMIGSLGIINGTMPDKVPEPARKLVDLAYKNAQRLLTLVNDLLDFAKIDAGRFTLETAPFSPCASIGKVTELMLGRCREKGLDLQVRYQTPVPEKMMGDAVRFEQVLLNLLSNAVKFTEKGGIKLFIRAFETEPGKPRLYIEVADTGIGITQEKLDYIFEKFTQEDESTTRRFGGTGLGLAISSDIVRLMGGQLKVNSKIGEGSTFFFDIPLHKIR